MAHENGDKQKATKSQHVQGMLDETDPLTDLQNMDFLKNILLEKPLKGQVSCNKGMFHLSHSRNL